ncbi:AAA family ATPase [Marimonas arenosa]|uniref:ATP-binding protein n=1 Tax=Marimonas arenosa TaxID=1795305 RepID=A0AAE3WEX2_9RHOB|nr:ATP-binding protein [Marimonas arenosa]MDQ2091110.1 ATP-binding protein [Marimonas arenosa]
MSRSSPTLHLVCGKVASGKSTLTRKLGQSPGTVVIAEDDWLSALFSDEMSSISDYARCAAKLRNTMGPHVASLLKSGVSVVLDFPANTLASRTWMRGIIQAANVAHRLHYLDVPDEVCIARLRARNAGGEHPFVVTDEQFRQLSEHFVVPSTGEGFNIVRHGPDDTR